MLTTGKVGGSGRPGCIICWKVMRFQQIWWRGKDAKGILFPPAYIRCFGTRRNCLRTQILTRNIRQALENSDLLVVLCSPRAVESRFVADEIRYFKELRKANRILALMIDGEPNAADDPGKAKLGIKPEGRVSAGAVAIWRGRG